MKKRKTQEKQRSANEICKNGRETKKYEEVCISKEDDEWENKKL